jgi:hypothetical protein
MGCIEKVVCSSSQVGANKAQLIRNATGESLVKFYNWSAFLLQFFSKVSAVTSYHVFRFDSSSPRTIFLRKSAKSPEEEVDILFHPVPNEAFPDEIPPLGLQPQRQWYLYDNIQQFCSSNLAADITCPKPNVPRPGVGPSGITSRKRQQSASGSSKSKR